MTKSNSNPLLLLKLEFGGLLGSIIEPVIFAGPQMAFLIGKGATKFEAALGGSLFYFYHYNENNFLPIGALGFRYLNKNEKFIFRLGLGFPNGIYISGGLRF